MKNSSPSNPNQESQAQPSKVRQELTPWPPMPRQPRRPRLQSLLLQPDLRDSHQRLQVQEACRNLLDPNTCFAPIFGPNGIIEQWREQLLGQVSDPDTEFDPRHLASSITTIDALMEIIREHGQSKKYIADATHQPTIEP